MVCGDAEGYQLKVPRLTLNYIRTTSIVDIDLDVFELSSRMIGFVAYVVRYPA